MSNEFTTKLSDISIREYFPTSNGLAINGNADKFEPQQIVDGIIEAMVRGTTDYNKTMMMALFRGEYGVNPPLYNNVEIGYYEPFFTYLMRCHLIRTDPELVQPTSFNSESDRIAREMVDGFVKLLVGCFAVETSSTLVRELNKVKTSYKNRPLGKQGNTSVDETIVSRVKLEIGKVLANHDTLKGILASTDLSEGFPGNTPSKKYPTYNAALRSGKYRYFLPKPLEDYKLDHFPRSNYIANGLYNSLYNDIIFDLEDRSVLLGNLNKITETIIYSRNYDLNTLGDDPFRDYINSISTDDLVEYTTLGGSSHALGVYDLSIGHYFHNGSRRESRDDHNLNIAYPIHYVINGIIKLYLSVSEEYDLSDISSRNTVLAESIARSRAATANVFRALTNHIAVLDLSDSPPDAEQVLAYWMSIPFKYKSSLYSSRNSLIRQDGFYSYYYTYDNESKEFTEKWKKVHNILHNELGVFTYLISTDIHKLEKRNFSLTGPNGVSSRIGAFKDAYNRLNNTEKHSVVQTIGMALKHVFNHPADMDLKGLAILSSYKDSTLSELDYKGTGYVTLREIRESFEAIANDTEFLDNPGPGMIEELKTNSIDPYTLGVYLAKYATPKENTNNAKELKYNELLVKIDSQILGERRKEYAREQLELNNANSGTDNSASTLDAASGTIDELIALNNKYTELNNLFKQMVDNKGDLDNIDRLSEDASLGDYLDFSAHTELSEAAWNYNKYLTESNFNTAIQLFQERLGINNAVKALNAKLDAYKNTAGYPVTTERATYKPTLTSLQDFKNLAKKVLARSVVSSQVFTTKTNEINRATTYPAVMSVINDLVKATFNHADSYAELKRKYESINTNIPNKSRIDRLYNELYSSTGAKNIDPNKPTYEYIDKVNTLRSELDAAVGVNSLNRDFVAINAKLDEFQGLPGYSMVPDRASLTPTPTTLQHFKVMATDILNKSTASGSEYTRIETAIRGALSHRDTYELVKSLTKDPYNHQTDFTTIKQKYDGVSDGRNIKREITPLYERLYTNSGAKKLNTSTATIKEWVNELKRKLNEATEAEPVYREVVGLLNEIQVGKPDVYNDISPRTAGADKRTLEGFKQRLLQTKREIEEHNRISNAINKLNEYLTIVGLPDRATVQPLTSLSDFKALANKALNRFEVNQQTHNTKRNLIGNASTYPDVVAPLDGLTRSSFNLATSFSDIKRKYDSIDNGRSIKNQITPMFNELFTSTGPKTLDLPVYVLREKLDALNRKLDEAVGGNSLFEDIRNLNNKLEEFKRLPGYPITSTRATYEPTATPINEYRNLAKEILNKASISKSEHTRLDSAIQNAGTHRAVYDLVKTLTKDNYNHQTDFAEIKGKYDRISNDRAIKTQAKRLYDELYTNTGAKNVTLPTVTIKEKVASLKEKLEEALDSETLYKEVKGMLNDIRGKHQIYDEINGNVNAANKATLEQYKNRLLASKQDLSDRLSAEKNRLRDIVNNEVTNPSKRGEFLASITGLNDLSQVNPLEITIDNWIINNEPVKFPRQFKRYIGYNANSAKNIHASVNSSIPVDHYVTEFTKLTSAISAINNARIRKTLETHLYKFSGTTPDINRIKGVIDGVATNDYLDAGGNFLLNSDAAKKARTLKNEWALISPDYKNTNIIRQDGFYFTSDESQPPRLIVAKPITALIRQYLPTTGSPDIPSNLNDEQYNELLDYINSFHLFLRGQKVPADVTAVQRINEKATAFGITSAPLTEDTSSNTVDALRNKVIEILNASSLPATEIQSKTAEVNRIAEPSLLYSMIKSLEKKDPRETARTRIENKIERILGDDRKRPLNNTWLNILANPSYTLQDIDDLEAKIDDRINGNDEYTQIDTLMKQIGSSDRVVQEVNAQIPDATEVELRSILQRLQDRRAVMSRRGESRDLANRLLANDNDAKVRFHNEINRADSISTLDEIDGRIRSWAAEKERQGRRKETVKNRIESVRGDERKRPLTERWNALNTATYNESDFERLDETITDRITGNNTYTEILSLITELTDSDKKVVEVKPRIPNADKDELILIRNALLDRKVFLTKYLEVRKLVNALTDESIKTALLAETEQAQTIPALEDIARRANTQKDEENRRVAERQRILGKINNILGDERKRPIQDKFNVLKEVRPYNNAQWNNLEREVDDRISGNPIYTEIKGILATMPDNQDHPTVIRVNNRIPDANALLLQTLKEELITLRNFLNKKSGLVNLAGNINDVAIRTEMIRLLNEATTIPRLNELERLINTHIRLNSLRREALEAIAQLPDTEALKAKLSAEERAALSAEALISIKNRALRRKAELEAPPPRPRKPKTEVEIKPNLPSIPKVKRFTYEFDPTGKRKENLITNERHTITPSNRTPQNVIIPGFAPFFRQSLIVTDMQSGLPLLEGIDYTVEWPIHAASHDSNLEGYTPLYGGIQFIDPEITGQFEIQYQTVGGQFALDGVQIAQALANQANDPLTTTFESIIGRPIKLPPLEHVHSIEDFVGFNDLCDSVDRLRDVILLLAREDAENHPGYDTLVDTYFSLQNMVKLLQQANNALEDRLEVATHNLTDNVNGLINGLREQITSQFNSTVESQNNEIGTIRTLVNQKVSEITQLVNSETEKLNRLLETKSTELSNQLRDKSSELERKIETAKTDLNGKITEAKRELTNNLDTYKQSTNSTLGTIQGRIDGMNRDFGGRINAIEAKVAMRITESNGKLTYGGRPYLNADDLTTINQNIEIARDAGADWNRNLRNIPGTLHYSTRPTVTVTTSAIQPGGLDVIHGGRRFALELDPTTKGWKLVRGFVNNSNEINKGQDIIFPITSGTQTVAYESWVNNKIAEANRSIGSLNSSVGDKLSKSDFEQRFSALSRKVDEKAATSALEEQVRNLTTNINGKVSNTDFTQRISEINRNLDNKVSKSGDETINGVKTFNAKPKVPGIDIGVNNASVRASTVESRHCIEVDNLSVSDIYVRSDKRIKSDIKPISQALDKICQLKGYTYYLNDSSMLDSGVIAQEVADIIPHLVSKQQENDLLTVNYIGLFGYLIEAIKELKEENKVLRNELLNR